MKTLLKLVAALVAALVLVVAAFGGGVWFERTVRDAGGQPVDTVDLEAAVGEVAGIIENQALAPSSEASMTAGCPGLSPSTSTPNIGCASRLVIGAKRGSGVSRRESTRITRPSRGFGSSDAGNDTSIRNGGAEKQGTSAQ